MKIERVKTDSSEQEFNTLPFDLTLATIPQDEHVKRLTIRALQWFLRKIGVPRRFVKMKEDNSLRGLVELEDLCKPCNFSIGKWKENTKSIAKLGWFYKELRGSGMLHSYPFVGYYSLNISKNKVREDITDEPLYSYENVLEDHLSVGIIDSVKYVRARENADVLDGVKSREDTICYMIETIFKEVFQDVDSVDLSILSKQVSFKKKDVSLSFDEASPFEQYVFLFLCDFILKCANLGIKNRFLGREYRCNDGVLIFDGGGDDVERVLQILQKHFYCMQFIHFRG